MKRLLSLIAGAIAIFGSYMAVLFGLSPAQSFGSGTVATIAFPGLMTGLVATWLIATEAKSAHTTAVQVHDLSLRLAHQEVELTRSATQDELTGLYSRSCFDKTTELELERATCLGRRFAILLVEVDGLNLFSERAGGVRRGYLLYEVASLLETMLSINDTASRYADSCFAVLLPETDIAGAMEVANGIQIQLEHREFYGRGDVTGSRLTASQGIVAFPSPGIETVPELERAAEAALREAKLAGGATIRVHTTITPAPVVKREVVGS